MEGIMETKRVVEPPVRDCMDDYLAGLPLDGERRGELTDFVKGGGSDDFLDLLALSRALPLHFHGEGKDEVNARVMRAILEAEAKRECRLLRFAKALQVAAILLSILLLGTSVYLVHVNYAYASAVDQMRITLSMALSVVALGLSLATRQIAYAEARIRSWFTGVWRAPTTIDMLVLRAEALALVVLVILLA